jgi:magnesium-transporting ATPase (P-type)
MLTGDKAETAQNIGISCGIIGVNSKKIIIIEQIEKKLLKSELESIISKYK